MQKLSNIQKYTKTAMYKIGFKGQFLMNTLLSVACELENGSG
jgi:hypothetical protein